MVKTSVSETPKLIASFQAALKREPLISKDESDWILDLITKSKKYLYVDFEEINRFFSGVKVIVDNDNEVDYQKFYSDPVIFTTSMLDKNDFLDFLDILKSNNCKELLDLFTGKGIKIIFQFTDYSEIILFPQSTEKKLLEMKKILDQYKGMVTLYGPLQDVINNLN